MEAPPKEVRDRETVKVSLIEIGISGGGSESAKNNYKGTKSNCVDFEGGENYSAIKKFWPQLKLL
jgi:hypothetical protein